MSELAMPRPVVGSFSASDIDPTIVTSSPSRIQTVPSPRRTSQCHLAHGSRYSRAGTLVLIVSLFPLVLAVAAPSAMARLSPRGRLSQTPSRSFHRLLVEFGVDELVGLGQLGDQRFLDLTRVDRPAELRGDIPRGGRIPFQFQGRVDGHERSRDLAASRGDDHA